GRQVDAQPVGRDVHRVDLTGGEGVAPDAGSPGEVVPEQVAVRAGIAGGAEVADIQLAGHGGEARSPDADDVGAERQRGHEPVTVVHVVDGGGPGGEDVLIAVGDGCRLGGRSGPGPTGDHETGAGASRQTQEAAPIDGLRHQLHLHARRSNPLYATRRGFGQSEEEKTDTFGPLVRVYR